MKKIILIITLFLIIPKVNAQSLSLNSKSAILMDEASGKVLYAENENERLPMASMTKIMSLILVMEAIDKDVISYDSEVVISENASSMGGSQIFLSPMDKYKVSELLKSVAMASANDSIVALAERTYGSVENFVDKMNEKAELLNLQNTHFDNPHGLDSKNHYSTAYDMAVMARELLKHDDILNYTKVYEEYLQKADGSKIWLVNTNKLVRYYEGLDGLKTGYTSNSGYCITATAKKNNFRLISVVMGENTIEDRSSDTVKLLNYGFNTYRVNLIKSKNESIGKVNVINGKDKMVDVRLLNDATELLGVDDEVSNYRFKINIKSIKAPVSVGDVVGNVTILSDDNDTINTVDITVMKNVLKANIWDIFKRNLEYVTSFN